METEQKRREPLFTGKALRALMIPLVIERFLEMAVGMADTVMVAGVGESAVSAISLVDNINNLVIFILAALATGGAVIASQYLGRDDVRNARVTANQLIYAVSLFSVTIAAVGLLTRGPLLDLVFGALEPDVMSQAQTYFWISLISYPFIAIFNSSAAIQRSMGISRMSMLVSLGMNLVNIGGNAILIFGFGWGVAGAATASLISRVLAACLMLYMVHNRSHAIYVSNLLRFRVNLPTIRNILRIGIPSGLENGLFHIGRIITQSLVSTYGTSVIAANAASMRIIFLAQVYGVSTGMALITVVGQCVGAKEYEQARRYTRKLIGSAYLAQCFMLSLMFLFAPQLSGMFNLSPEGMRLSVLMLRSYVVAALFIYPPAFPLSNVFRAAGDVRYPMVVSIVSMGLVRVALSYVLAINFNLGVMGVWYAMYADWVVRAAAFLTRYFNGKWYAKTVV